MEKLKYKKLELMQTRIKNKSELPVGKWTIPNQIRLVVYHLLEKNNKGRVRQTPCPIVRDR